MGPRYHEYPSLNLPAFEQEILSLWNQERAFQASVEFREGSTPFVFYEGPPSANGMPGIHHVIGRTLKDLVCRYKTMQGYQVRRKGGWDTHGLPIELGVEKELGITKEDIGKTISIEDYNQKCREAVMRYKDVWDELTRIMGYWVDLDDPYITFENDYIESLWWCLKQLYQKGLLYESVSIQPYSPAAGTGLSSHELNQPGTYKMVKDTSCVAMFRAIHDARSAFLYKASAGKDVFFLAWTTTPWTLPSNLGLTVGGRIRYVLVETRNPYTEQEIHVVLAKDLMAKFFEGIDNTSNLGPGSGYDEKDAAPDSKKKVYGWKILAECTGEDLEHIRYDQLLPFEANNPEKSGGDPFRVLLGDFVTTEDGTGIVHTAPAFGADDFKVGRKYGIGILTMVDRAGKFVDGLGEFSGRYVKNYKDERDWQDVNVDIAVKLKKENRAFRVEKYEHSYPHCWRTDKPVLYYPLDAWFIKTTALRDRMVELNKTIRWKPKSTGEGRFGNWLENMVDWNLSRSRFWGTPLPIWKTEDGTEEKCIGSVAELETEIRKANEVLGGDVNQHYLHEGVLDLHRPYVDDIVLVSEGGLPMQRVPDLIDVWFDSGAMPYAQWHFPFGATHHKDLAMGKVPAFPADFVAEGVDQTRGWFYTLHALAVLLFDNVAFKTVVSNGLVLDKFGNKMSKRLGNVIDPFKTIHEFGADATRWYLVTNASPWDNLKFDMEGIREVQRKFFGTLFNTYQFFALYANVDGFRWQEEEIPLEDRPELDRWILSTLHSLNQRVAQFMDDYEPTMAGRAVEYFVVEQLSNWYVRLCRRRFWKGEYGPDKISAYQTLYECLETVTRLVAPVSPFFADALFRNLNMVTQRLKAGSVHLTDFPIGRTEYIQQDLEERMEMAQVFSSLILSIRKKVNIRVRQPLQRALIPVNHDRMRKQLEQVAEIIKSEVNIKELEFPDGEQMAIRKKVKPNFPVLGKKIGARMKAVTAILTNLNQEEIRRLESEGNLTLDVDNESITIELADVDVLSEDIPGWVVASQRGFTVALDIQVSPALEEEGHARELVNRIQKIRKDNGYELTDRISVKVVGQEKLNPAFRRFNDYICAEILADRLEMVADLDVGTEIEINDLLLKVLVSKNGY